MNMGQPGVFQTLSFSSFYLTTLRIRDIAAQNFSSLPPITLKHFKYLNSKSVVCASKGVHVFLVEVLQFQKIGFPILLILKVTSRTHVASFVSYLMEYQKPFVFHGMRKIDLLPIDLSILQQSCLQSQVKAQKVRVTK